MTAWPRPAPTAAETRARLRERANLLADCPVGTVPILWNNVDIPDLRPTFEAEAVLDEIARLGYDGCQFGSGFPTGEVLRVGLEARGLRLAEVYAAIECTTEGPAVDAVARAIERLAILHDAGGEVLCLALDGSPERSIRAGRADRPGTPHLSEAGWQRLAEVVETTARSAADAGHPLVFHPHAGTFVETPDEIARLVAATDPELVGICLDVGHALVGGGDPVRLVTGLGRRLRHVHLKDVDGRVLADLRADPRADFGDAVRARVFTELGAGILDLGGVLAGLAALDYRGWLMVEQDSSWFPPSEAAAIGRRVLAAALETGRSGEPAS